MSDILRVMCPHVNRVRADRIHTRFVCAGILARDTDSDRADMAAQGHEYIK